MREIVTDRLLLRPFRDDDFEAFAALHGDAKAMAQMYHGVMDRDAARRLFDHYLEVRRPGVPGMSAVVHRAQGTLIGECGFWDRDDGHGISLRFALMPAWWNRGLGTEAVQAVLDDAFDRIGLDQVVAVAQTTNPYSQRILLRMGMALADDRFKDTDGLHLFHLDRADWRGGG